MRCFLASLFFFLLAEADAQLPTDIKFTNYTRANGLPEETINNIMQDSRGFLWLGTREGLIRFDGLHYKTWYAKQGDKNRFPNNSIRMVGEAGNSNMLFLSSGELWKINITNLQISPAERFAGKTIIAIPEKIAGNHWLIIDYDSLYITGANLEKGYSLSFKNYFPPGVLVAAFPLSNPWCLLLGNNDNKAFFFNYGLKQMLPVHFDDSEIDSRARILTAQAYDSSSGRLYVSTFFNGSFYCDLQIPAVTNYRLTPFTAQPSGAVRKSVINNGLLLQAGLNGLAITDFQKSSSFSDASAIDNPPLSKTMVDIFQSRDGNCWISTVKGISRFSLHKPVVDYLRMKPALTGEDECKAILKGSDGNIYFLMGLKSLFRFDRRTNLLTKLDNTSKNNWAAIRNGDEIISTGVKHMVYNTATGKLSYPSLLKPFYTSNTDLVTLAFRARNGDLWYSCNGGGGLIRNPAGSKQYIQYSRNTTPPAFSHSYVHGGAEDSHGNIWWCSNKNQMLLKWNVTTHKFEEYEINKLIPEFTYQTGINNLCMDGNDNLWIALDAAALIKYNVNTKKGGYYDINKGLPTDAVSGMTTDAKNRLWFGTRKGLCCYLPERDKVVTFTKLDGIPDDYFEGNGIFYDKEENLLYAGAKNSITFFNPDTLLSSSTSTQPPVYIDEMKVNGSPWYFNAGKKIILKPSQNNLEFSFASPDFNRNSQLEFEYKLRGFVNNWVPIGDNRNVTFNNLAPGNYTILVRCKYKGNEYWTETTSPLFFQIQTPWNKTWWFRVVLAAFIIVLGWLLVRNYYRGKLEKQKAAAEKIQAIEKERTRIATDMHDDFGASLSRIKFISEKMQLTEKENEALKTDLTKISDYSDEMAEKMNEIVWALNQRYDSCADLVSFCRAYASEFLQDKNIRLNFSNNDIPDKKIQGEVRRNIFLVIKEALHNIVKHAKATEASVSFLFDDKTTTVSVSDNGRGFKPESVRPFANGLENMKKRMADINGQIIISGDAGTCIRLSVPI